MKLIDILEGDVVKMDRFRKPAPAAPQHTDPEAYDDMSDLGSREMREIDSPDNLENDMDKRRYMKFLNNRSGNIINDNKLVPYLRSLITNKKQFNTFVRMLLTNKTHLYKIIKEINIMLSNADANQRLVGVSPNAEDWYFK